MDKIVNKINTKLVQERAKAVMLTEKEIINTCPNAYRRKSNFATFKNIQISSLFFQPFLGSFFGHFPDHFGCSVIANK